MRFTNKLDFELTRRRFKMIARDFSYFRSGKSVMLLLPPLLIIVFLFCTGTASKYPYPIMIENDYIYSKPVLFINPPLSNKLNIQRRGLGIRYDSLGIPFTGQVEIRLRDGNSLLQLDNYENGLMIELIGFNVEGDSIYVYEFGYIADKYQVVREFKNGVLVMKWTASDSNGKLGTHREWHENGELKLDASFRGYFEYDGLMTLYDEQGNLLKQERYENGILTETIK